jgi:hypothetical protein
MFNVNKFLTTPQKFILEQNFKSYLYDSVNKYNKLTIETNEKMKTKKAMENILYGNTLIKSTNHSVNDLINNAKFNNFFLIFSFVSIGALIFYKKKQ